MIKKMEKTQYFYSKKCWALLAVYSHVKYTRVDQQNLAAELINLHLLRKDSIEVNFQVLEKNFSSSL